MDSKLLLERLPEITGNVKITVKLDGSVFLNIVGTNQALSISKLFNFPINTTFGLVNDYSNYLRLNSYRNLNDKIGKDQYVDQYHIQTSLLIGNKIPDLFIICDEKKDNEPTQMLQYYDLSENTTIGVYLNDYFREFNKTNPITINTGKREIYITGINLVTGIINQFQIIYDINDDINQKILTYVRENKILIPNILNIEFESEYANTNKRFYYADKVDLFKYDISKVVSNLYMKNKNLYLSSSCLADNNHSEGIPMSFTNDNFFLAYIDNKKELIGLSNERSCLRLNKDVKMNIDDIFEISLEKVYNPTSYSIFKYVGGITQSTFIDVYSDNYHIQLISDFMPNLLQAGIPFSATDNNYYIFNWIGTNNETMISFSKAWNDSSERYTKIRCVPKEDEIIFINDIGGSFNISINNDKIKEVSSFKENVLEYSYFKIKNTEEINITPNHYIIIDGKTHKIFGIVDNVYLDNSDGKLINDGKLLILEGDITDDYIETSVISFENPTIGLMNVMENIVCKKEFISNIKNMFDISNFLKPQILHNVTYKVVSSNTVIKYKGVARSTGNTFVGRGNASTFEIIRGIGNVCEIRYANDTELKSMFDTDTNIDNKIVTKDIIFSQNYNTDFEGQISNLLAYNTPKNNVFVIDSNNRTNEWLIPTEYPYLQEKYDISKIAVGDDNYSEKLLKDFATTFEKNGSIYKTTFRGVEIISTNNLEEYRFAAILNICNESDYYGGTKIRIIKNDVDKFIVLVVDIPLSDYRFINRFNFCMLYNSKNTKGSSTSLHISYNFVGLSFNGIKIKCLITKIENDRVVFNQKMPIRSLITESNDGIALIFRSKDGNTILSNYGYVSGGIIVKENNVFKISMSDNNVILEGGYMYVSKVNGIAYNTEMYYTEISTLINFEGMECYQIGNFENDLENLFSISNFSNIKENINLNKTFVEKYTIDSNGNISEDTSIDIVMFQPETCNSGQYNIPIKIEESHAGSTTPNIFGVYNNLWNKQDHTWSSDQNSTNVLDKYFNKKLNLIY